MPKSLRRLLLSLALCAIPLAAPIAQDWFTSRAYGSAGTWDVWAMYEGGSFVGCSTAHRQFVGQSGMVLGIDGNWVLAFETPAPHGVVTAQLTIDGRSWSLPAMAEGNRVGVPVTAQIAEAVRSGNVLTIAAPGVNFTAVLAGSAGAMNMVETCVRHRGN